jgi:hypothetical protein
MLRLLAIAAMLALAPPTLAMAEDHDDHHPGGQPHPGPGGPPGKPFIQPHGPPFGAPHPGPPGAVFVPHPGSPGPMFAPHPGPLGMEGPHPGGPPGARFSYRGHMMDRVHRDPFIYPPGWAYRRWGIGAALPPIFLVPDYFYPEWAALGLEPPPPGYQWVRYGSDLLLVELDNGQVVDVAYDVFD